MKIQKSNKKSFLKKIFIKICRLLNFEIIDQSSFTVPTLKKRLDENLSSAGRKSISLTDKGFRFLEKYQTILGFIDEFEL